MCAWLVQLVGTDQVPEGDEGVQRLLLGALLLPQLLGLSAADAAAARRLADSAKVRHRLLSVVLEHRRAQNAALNGAALPSTWRRTAPSSARCLV